MMGMMLEFRRYVVFNGTLDHIHVLSRTYAGSVANAENMGVDRLRGLFKPHVQHNVRGFPAHSGEGLKGSARRGDHSVILIDQKLGEFDDVLGLLAIKPDGLDMLGHAFRNRRKISKMVL